MPDDAHAEPWIGCQFSFLCPQKWDSLEPTENQHIRHCPECKKDVHLVRNKEEFAAHAAKGHCVAALRSEKDGDGSKTMMVGGTTAEYRHNP